VSGFDKVGVVDWSAASKCLPTKPSKDAIWLGLARGGAVEPPHYFRSRAKAEVHLVTLIEAEESAGLRLLLGFCFPFGYPKGVAKALTDRADPFAVWA